MICDEVDMLTKVKAISQGMCWETRWADHESGSYNPKKILVGVKFLAGFLTLQRAGFIKLNFPLVFLGGSSGSSSGLCSFIGHHVWSLGIHYSILQYSWLPTGSYHRNLAIWILFFPFEIW